jgi:hypothetical protein
MRTWFLILSLLCLGTNATAQVDTFESGPLLYLLAEPDAIVRLDGTKVGTGSMILPTLSSGTHSLEVSSDKGISETTLTIRASIAGLTVYQPTLRRWTGSLKVTFPGATVHLDGNVLGTSPATFDGIPSGPHELSLQADGLGTVWMSVDVPRRNHVVVDRRLEPSHALTFTPALPPEAMISVRGTANSGTEYNKVFSAAEPIRLEPGVYAATVFLGGFPVLECEYRTESSESIAFLPKTVPTTIAGLGEGALVFVDGSTSPVNLKSLSLTPGLHTLKIVDPSAGIVDTFIFVGDSQRYTITLGESSASMSSQQANLGITLAIAGAVLSLGGFIFNMDSIAIPLSSDYDSYNAIKYASLACMGIGLAGVGTGGFFIFSE